MAATPSRSKSAASRKSASAKRKSTAAKKRTGKPASTRKPTARKSARPRSAAKKTATKKSGTSSSGKSSANGGKRAKSSGAKRKYSPKAANFVKKEMEEMKHGQLHSGRSGKKVKNPKQAIAIGLSEARRHGEKVPPNPNKKAA